MSKRNYSICALALVLMAAPCCFGQAEVTGRIRGTATDNSQAVIAGVVVRVEGPTLFTPRSTLTGADGAYFVDKLPPGTYTVTASMPGFKKRFERTLALLQISLPRS